MIHRLCLARLLLFTFFLSSFVAAWPWPPSFENVESLLHRRQDDSKKDAAASDSPPSSATKTQALKSEASLASASRTEASGSKKPASTSASVSRKAGSSKSTEEPSKTTAVDDQSPAGAIVMITPAPEAAAEYYKIGDKVEFKWNYTSLIIPPKAIDVLVSCNANHATYTIASNATFQPTGSVVWDTKKDAQGQGNLITETYTLIIYDAAEDITAVPQPGHLATFNSLRFGMYIRRPYVPRDEWKCATCSGALSNMERQTLKFVFGMCTITVMSFTWFAGGFLVGF